MTRERIFPVEDGDIQFFVASVDLDADDVNSGYSEISDSGLGERVHLDGVVSAAEHIGEALHERLKSLKPDKTTIEIEIGFATSSGKLFALLGEAKGSGSVTVTLEWDDSKQ